MRRERWIRQRDLGLDHIPSNDFSLYDHVLDAALMVGAVPDRYRGDGNDLDAYFAMARGGEVQGRPVQALEMTKWFDTNYHYIVPELTPGQRFAYSGSKTVDEFREAAELGIITRPVLLGPISFLTLAKQRGDRTPVVALAPALVDVYEAVLADLAAAGAQWVQIDEPALGLDLDVEVIDAFKAAYQRLTRSAPSLRLLVATYFSGLRDNLGLALNLPVAAVHLDLVRDPSQLDVALDRAPEGLAFSLGVVDGRNVWRADLDAALARLEHARNRMGADRLLVAPSCSLLHMPLDLEGETRLDPELRQWLAFAVQRIEEVVVLARGLNGGREAVAEQLGASSRARSARASSPGFTTKPSKSGCARPAPISNRASARTRSAGRSRRSDSHCLRFRPQPSVRFRKPPRPIVESPSSNRRPRRPELRARHARARRARGRFQESIGLDVLVHGEFERNDMVEYFGEQLRGFAVSEQGWVQSYGSRCVKPPMIYGDVSRLQPMTVAWTSYAQSLTERPVKGMLTGPVTILQWSFVRDDQPREQTCRQIALAIRDEVADLEAAGIAIVQIDEPALREGLPLHREDWPEYLSWAVAAFRLASSGAADETQIHTHMCYAEFQDIIGAIAAFDADVISIETARSQMELLRTFSDYRYPNEIGPGIWDIHSPRSLTSRRSSHSLTVLSRRSHPSSSG